MSISNSCIRVTLDNSSKFKCYCIVMLNCPCPTIKILGFFLIYKLPQ